MRVSSTLKELPDSCLTTTAVCGASVRTPFIRALSEQEVATARMTDAVRRCLKIFIFLEN